MPSTNKPTALKPQPKTVGASLEAFGADVPKPPKPPGPLTLAATVRADRIAYGKADAARVVAKLDTLLLVEIMLDPEYGPTLQRAAMRRLAEMQARAP